MFHLVHFFTNILKLRFLKFSNPLLQRFGISIEVINFVIENYTLYL